MNVDSSKKKKKTCSVIALFLMLSMILPMTFLSTANAHTPGGLISPHQPQEEVAATDGAT